MTIRGLFFILTLSSLPLFIWGRAACGADMAYNLYPLAEGDSQLSCRKLDRRLTELAPQSHTRQADFYADPAHGVAIWTGMLWEPAWAYVGYSAVKQIYLQVRLDDVHGAMEELRLAKAQRHCYEP